MNLKNSFLVLLSALTLSLVFYSPDQFSYLSFFFLVPTLIYIDRTRQNYSKRKDYILFFSSFYIFGLIASSWFVSIYPLTWAGVESKLQSVVVVFPLWLFLTAIFTAPISLWILLARRSYLVGICSWILLEYTRSFLMIAGLYSPGISLSPHYTYFSIGYSVYNISLFKELLPAGGIYLASFVILLVNYFIYFVLFKKDRRPMQALLLISLVVLIVLASNILRNKIRTDGVTKEILVGNAKFASSNDMEKEMQKGDAAIEAINYYLFEDTASGTQVFILPENFDVYNEFAKWNERGKNIFLKDVLVVGSYSNNHEKMYYLDSQKKTAGIYEKQILMPIGEYSPWFMTLIKKVFYGDTLPWRNVESGKTPSVFSYNDFKFGSSICSENVSPYIFSSEVRGGANVILNLASHAPFSGSKLLDEQTLVGNTTRALETGRYVVTATNYGTSFVIDDIGNAIYLQKHNKEGEFEFSKQKIKLLTYKTPYVIFGDYIVYLCLIFLLYYYLFRSSSGK